MEIQRNTAYKPQYSTASRHNRIQDALRRIGYATTRRQINGQLIPLVIVATSQEVRQ